MIAGDHIWGDSQSILGALPPPIYIYIRPCRQLVSLSVITCQNLQGEFYWAQRDRYLPICLPASASNNRRELETRQHRQVVWRSALLPFDVCESTHQQVEAASSWHARSPTPHPEKHTADCLAVRTSWAVVVWNERMGLRWQTGLVAFFLPFNRASSLAPSESAQDAWWWGGLLPFTSFSCQPRARVASVFLFTAGAPLHRPLHP